MKVVGITWVVRVQIPGDLQDLGRGPVTGTSTSGNSSTDAAHMLGNPYLERLSLFFFHGYMLFH